MAALNRKQCMMMVLYLAMAIGMMSHVMCRELKEESSMLERFEQWMEKYGRVYASAADKETRFKIFTDNVDYVESFNSAGNKPYKLSINGFADQTNQEFMASNFGYKKPSGSETRTRSFKYENFTDIPTSMDWREKGAVTAIKDQGPCGNYPEENINQFHTHTLTLLHIVVFKSLLAVEETTLLKSENCR